jgi:hypothetical protein
MTTHFEHRKTNILHPAADRNTTVTEPVAAPRESNGRRTPRWVALVGIAIGAACVVGVGVLMVDADTEPAQPPAVEFTDTGTSQRLVQDSINGALAANQSAFFGADQGTSQRLVQGSIDAALVANGN